MDKINLLHGSCEDHIPTLQDNSIDFVFCDLPYGVSDCNWDTPINLKWMWQELWHICKSNTAIALTATQPFATDLINSQREYFKYDWIWAKKNPSNFLQAKYMPMRIHEQVLIFYRHPPIYNPQRSRPYSPDMLKKVGQKQGPAPSDFYGSKRMEKQELVLHPEGMLPQTIQAWGNVSNSARYHPSEKPVAMMADLIKTYTNEEAVVLDFCMGSGSTGVAAKGGSL